MDSSTSTISKTFLTFEMSALKDFKLNMKKLILLKPLAVKIQGAWVLQKANIPCNFYRLEALVIEKNQIHDDLKSIFKNPSMISVLKGIKMLPSSNEDLT